MDTPLRRRMSARKAVISLCVAALLASIPITSEAESLTLGTDVYVGCGVNYLIEKDRHASPMTYHGFLLSPEIGLVGRSSSSDWELRIPFNIGSLDREAADNTLAAMSGLESDARKTEHPLRLKAAIEYAYMPRVFGGDGTRLCVGGNLAYRFDMTIHTDYPIFMTSLDLGPACELDIPFRSGAWFSAMIEVPLIGLFNLPPFTGTDGQIIENIGKEPLKVIFNERFGTLIDRPLAKGRFSFGIPLGRWFEALSVTSIEVFSLETSRNWSVFSVQTLLALAIKFEEEQHEKK